MTEIENKRWRVKITIRSNTGDIERNFFIDELEELQGIVEGGDHFHSIIKIEIFYRLNDGVIVPIEELKDQ